ncbi:MAG TPA: HD domain-containing protein [Candidatus Limnocylindria bacterium]|nr:HD domain-containing protein [Candidatus Limnocylindria bacterium]
MADVPVRGRALTDLSSDLGELALPADVATVLQTLAAAGHEAALVGGCVRDLVRGLQPDDWDIATEAPPETVAALFPDTTWTNIFGTVTVRSGPMDVEVTTYRSESGYSDGRRPDEVRWATELTDDLGRRDFTINAMAWVPDDLEAGRGHLVDPRGGREDLAARVLRAVGDPGQRFTEDALRLLRGVRFATTLRLRIDPATEAAMGKMAEAAGRLSGERIRDELLRLLAFDGPTAPAFLLMERLGILVAILPELAALRGVEQGKLLGGDALDHSLRAADALPATDPLLRLAGLLHDVGKARTGAGGHFIGHETVGAQLVGERLEALALPRADIERVSHLVRHHMILYSPDWSDAAVRRFIRRIGPGQPLTDLFALRRADTAASAGPEARDAAASELESRVAALQAAAVLSVSELAVNGTDLMRELGLEPGPEVGRLLELLLQAALDDPRRNERDTLIRLAREAHGPRPA